jgi:23S rRNA (uracil1939-C5)-methyltransferase
VDYERDRDRTENLRPPCPHYPACHGCPFVHFPYREQLAKKQEIVARALHEYSSLTSIEIPMPVPSARQFGYRARTKLAVRKAKGKILIGLYIPESHEVADISACPVHPQPVNQIIQFLKEGIEKLGIIPYDEEHDTGQLRYLDLRYSFWQQQALLTLVTRHMHFPQARDLLRNLERQFPFLVGVVQNINDKPGNVIWGERFAPLRGRDALMEKLGPLKISIPVNAFSQVNTQVARKLYEKTLEWAGLTGKEIAFDLYCGIGPISLFLASQAQLVIGIDDNVGAINTAKQNARRNGYNNCRFFAGDAAEKLRETATSVARVDVIVVNPPRKGLSTDTFAAILTTKTPKVIYISCDPTTLARDLDRFSVEGYLVQRVQPFDMFPQTDKVETVALLERQTPITVGSLAE